MHSKSVIVGKDCKDMPPRRLDACARRHPPA